MNNLHIWCVFLSNSCQFQNWGKINFLCKYSIWFLGSVNPNLLSKHQKQCMNCFSNGGIELQNTLFFVLPISLHLFCQREESTSAVKKQKMLFGGVWVSACPVHSQTTEGDSLLLNVSTLLEYNVCPFLYTHETFYFPYMVFLCPFETIYNKHFVNDSPTCWVLVLQRWRTYSGQHAVKKNNVLPVNWKSYFDKWVQSGKWP